MMKKESPLGAGATKGSSARYSIVPALALQDTRLSPRDLTVLMLLGTFADQRGYCYPSTARMARMLGTSRSSVQRSIKRLAQCGYLSVQARSRADSGQTSNLYRVLLDNVPPDEVLREEKMVTRAYPDEPQEIAETADNPLPHNEAPPASPVTPPLPHNEAPPASPVLPHRTIPRELSQKKGKTPPPPFQGVGDLLDDQQQASSNPVREVFHHWQQVMNHPRAKLDHRRRDAIGRALKNYTPDELKQAINGCKASPYHMGDNDRRAVYDSIGLIFRSSDHIERFIRYAANPPAQTKKSLSLAERNALAAQEAMRREFGEAWPDNGTIIEHSTPDDTGLFSALEATA